MQISISEFGRIPRSKISSKLLKRLQTFDEKFTTSLSNSVFDWSHIKYVRAQNYVGVIQVPGLTVEILPKIDSASTENKDPFEKGGQQAVRAQQNLLFMLSFTKKIPLRDRDVASLRLQKMPLLEALAIIFVEKLLVELGKGLDHSYVQKEENAHFLKGKLLITKHLRHNSIHKERVYIGHEEFIPDTWLNRILKAACYQLLDLVKAARAQKRLREALLYLSDVSDMHIQEHHFKNVYLTRNTKRFETLYEFSKIVLLKSTPAPSLGTQKTFSLLFPMETLFEEFIARFISRYSEQFRILRYQIHIQATKRSKWLLRNSEGSGCFKLKPDIIIDQEKNLPRLIIDTKWKRLKSDQEDRKNGVSQADIYQLYAYANQYNSVDNVLLFPRVSDVTSKNYLIDGNSNKKIRVEFIDLNFDLMKNKNRLLGELQRIILR